MSTENDVSQYYVDTIDINYHYIKTKADKESLVDNFSNKNKLELFHTDLFVDICFVYHCLFFCPFGHCVVCSSSALAWFVRYLCY